LSRARDRVGRRRSPDHEARCRHDTISVSRLDRLVDFARETEVIRRYDQFFQCATPRRSRRK
jgi:hypothetical protein